MMWGNMECEGGEQWERKKGKRTRKERGGRKKVRDQADTEERNGQMKIYYYSRVKTEKKYSRNLILRHLRAIFDLY